MPLVRDTNPTVAKLLPGLQNPQRRRWNLSPERWPAVLVHEPPAEGWGPMSYVAWTDKGRFRKMHAALPGEQHTACSLWLEYSPINGYRFPVFADDKETCKRCQSVLHRMIREAS